MTKKNDDIQAIYSVGSSVSVVDKTSKHRHGKGIIERLGAAGEVLYYHVKLEGFTTPVTFVERQLAKLPIDKPAKA